MPLNSSNFLEATVPEAQSFLTETIADTPQNNFEANTVEETDPQAFFDQRRQRLLDRVGMEFGGDLNVGRTTGTMFRGLWNIFDAIPDTDFSRLHEDLI